MKRFPNLLQKKTALLQRFAALKQHCKNLVFLKCCLSAVKRRKSAGFFRSVLIEKINLAFFAFQVDGEGGGHRLCVCSDTAVALFLC